MDNARKKLIEELIRVGRLIDPVPSSNQKEIDDAADFLGPTEDLDVDAVMSEPDPEDIPVVDDVADLPYSTKDMFSAPVTSHSSSTAKPQELDQISSNTSHLNNSLMSDREETSSLSRWEQPLEPDAIRFPVEELARELVTLIEDRVNQRSGEQLDDTFRDELTRAVTVQLEGWLK